MSDIEEDNISEIDEDEEVENDSFFNHEDEKYLNEAKKIRDSKGEVIYFKRQKSRIPTRSSFVKKQPLTNIIRFNPIDTMEENREKYVLYLIGILESGEKAVVQLNNISVYFDLKVPFYVDSNNVEKQVNIQIFTSKIAKLFENGIKIYSYGKYIDVADPINIKVMKFRHFKHYTEPIYYLRLFFNKLDERRNAITYFRDPKNFKDFTVREMNNEEGKIIGNSYETASDDLSCYYRKVCRDYKDTLKFADWGEFKNYEIDEDKFKCRCFVIDIKDYSICKESISRDKVIECNFDIETYSNVYTQGVPKALNNDGTWNPNSCVFMICLNFNYWYSNEIILNVCITDKPTAPMENKLTIICENEEEIIQCFAHVFECMSPDLLIGFNSGSYDIPFIIETAQKIQNRRDGVFGKGVGSENPYLLNDVLKKMSLVRDYRPYFKNIYSSIQIKLEAGRNVDEYILQLPGFICLDVMNIYRKIYNKSPKYSLKFFLTENKLGNKYDLPYQKLFYIYKLASLKKRLGSEFKKFENTKYLHKLSDFFEGSLENDYTKDQIERIKEKAKLNNNNIKDREKFYLAAADIELSDFNEFTEKQIKVMNVNFKEMDYVDELMALAGEYCVIDSLSCHKLMLCRNVLQDKREMANMAYCNIFDCVFRADGMKVRNMIIANGQTEGIVFTNITNGDEEKKYTGKYPGAFVVDPIQGLYKAKPNLVEFWKMFQKN